MSQQPNTRQELYDRIRESSKDEVILEEMIRLGFWPRDSEQPNDPAEEIRRRGQLQRELAELRKQRARLGNEAALRKELYKQRLAESRKKKAETKRRRLDERKQRAHAHALKKREAIEYLGEGVSGGLSNAESDAARLEAQGLPVLATAKELSEKTGLEVGHLRYLTFHRKVSRTSHYVRFDLPKKTGGTRRISAPMPRLKWLQTWILQHVLEPVAASTHAHGFRPGRSIVTNAEAHVGAKVVVNIDLADFFPTVTYPRVKGLFRSLGYSEELATIFGLACTEPDVAEVELDGKTYFVHEGARHLPQGAPSSPAITNLICRRLDARVAALAGQLGFTFTRYADDFTFSTASDAPDIGRLLGRLNRIVKEEGFSIHRKKTRVLRRGRRQEVTGLVINDGRVTVPRDALKRFRALLFQIERDGPEGKRWGASKDVLSSIHGFASFVMMVDREKGGQLMARVRKILAAHGAPPPKKKSRAPTEAAREVLFRPIPAPREPEPEPIPPPTKKEAREESARVEKERVRAEAAPVWARIVAKLIDFALVGLTVWGFGRFFGSEALGLLVGYGWLLISDVNSITKPWFSMKCVMAKTGEDCTFLGSIQRNAVFTIVSLLPRLHQAMSGMSAADYRAENVTIRVLGLFAVFAVIAMELWAVYNSDDRTRWGDQLAGTRVINAKKTPPSEPAA